MSFGKTIKLNSGYEIPVIGLGTWLSKPKEVENAVETALKVGYRHIDAAAVYQNENEVGNAIKKSGVPREEIFVTSKLWNNSHRPELVEKALDKTLADLQLDYVDLYLIHWPVSFVPGKELIPIDPKTGIAEVEQVPIEETWKAMEKLLDTGKVKSIGVSNFTVENLEKILKIAKVVPAVNQHEAHVFLQQPALEAFHKKHGIHATAYSPLGNNVYGKPRVIDDEKVNAIAKKLDVPVANLLIAFLVQKGFTVVPKSVTPSRIESNFKQIVIPDDVVAELTKLDKESRYNDPVEWGVDIFGEQGGDAKAYEKAKKIAAEKKD